MNALLVILGLAFLFYLVHRLHERVGGVGSPRTGAHHDGLRVGLGLLAILVLLLPLMLLHTLAPAGSAIHPLLFWALLLLPVIFLPLLAPHAKGPEAEELAARREAEEEAREAAWRQERLRVVGPLGERAAKEMEIDGTRYEGELVVFEGRLRGATEAVYARLAESFAEIGYAPRLLDGERGRVVIVASPIAPATLEAGRRSLVIPLVLLAATVVTTTWAGALHQGVDLWREPARFAVGLPYSLALMTILLIHELGHYVAGRLHGIDVTLPYFIPVPMGLGTFGAFIRIRGAIPDRRKLFDVGVAGPLAGLAVALPALYLGLTGTVAAPGGPGISLSSSVLLAWLYGLATGGSVSPEHVVVLSPLGFAGWLGLLVTALNLIPVGQLDGGHVAYALVGRRRAETLGWIAFFLLLALGIFYWSGWLTWAILVFFLGGVKHEPALNELPAPGWRRRAVGVLAFVLLFLIMAPVPHRFMSALGIIRPYF